jgi:hypothetical protein
MSGSKMSVIYIGEAGDNVTPSPRSSSGHSEPSFDRVCKSNYSEALAYWMG